MSAEQTTNRGEVQLEELKKALGTAVARYTEGQLHQLQREIDVMAELLLDFYLWNKAQSSEPHRPQAAIDSRNGAAILLDKGPSSKSPSIS